MFKVVNYNVSEIIALISHLWESQKKTVEETESENFKGSIWKNYHNQSTHIYSTKPSFLK